MKGCVELRLVLHACPRSLTWTINNLFLCSTATAAS